jgi:pimeloyl-ACP methyl ester carboxylesterase
MKIWTVSKNESSPKTPIVLVHGYCGGVALWAHNFDSLSKSHPLYAFDLIGFGRSSRPSFSQDPIVAEMQFVESIEDWRKQMNIDKMILLGHSLGGFLISSYAIKYPKHTKALILVDPWGFQENENQNPVDTPTPMWVKLITNVSRYVSPLSVFRAAGSISVSFFKYLRPDFKQKYISVIGNNDLIYDYLYHLNRLKPRYT